MKFVDWVAGGLAGMALLGSFSPAVFGQTTSVTAADVASWNVDQAQSNIARLQATTPPASCGAVASTWLNAQDVNTLFNQNQLSKSSNAADVLLHALNVAGLIGPKFSVSWTGCVKVPYDGSYTFSISPVSVECDEIDESCHQSMSVTVGGQQVINATGENWVSEGKAISLKASQMVPLLVTFSYEYNRETIPTRFPAVARLLWQGPGVTKQLVPASALFSADGTTAGLAAEYVVDGKTQSVTESTIDHAWLMEVPLVPKYPELSAKLTARVRSLATASDYMGKLEANPSSTQHFLLGSKTTTYQMLASLGSVQNRVLAEELLAHPSLLQNATPEAVFTIYGLARIDSPETAISLVGKWTQLHPEAEIDFSQNLPKARRVYFWVAEALTYQYPSHKDVVERSYLSLSDGGCCLPVAYTLAVCHAMMGSMDTWIAKLDDQLKTEGLVGDQRVGWLLARAFAEEIRHAGTTGRSRGRLSFRVLAGRQWLDEACLAAKTEPVRLRAYKELIVRLVSDGQYNAAKEQLQNAVKYCTLASSVATITAWKKEVGLYSTDAVESVQTQKTASQEAYWNEIRARRNKAVTAGDKDAVSKYESLMNAAGVTP